MPTHAESNACGACARSKRKCGRQVPSCARCTERGTTCVYPHARSRPASSCRPLRSFSERSLEPRVEGRLLAEVLGDTSSHTTHCTTDILLTDDLMLDLTFPPMGNDFAAPSSLIQTPTPSVSATTADWFLAPETWKISHRVDTSADGAVGIAAVKEYVKVLQSWFERWVTAGSNPFIHSRLYSANFPACVQVAYATLSSYIHRTPANTDTVLRIVEDRSNDLLQENGAALSVVGEEEWTSREEKHVELFAQLSRLHALMVYQVIGLFDGDIRSRHVAQGHLAVQDIWANKLFHSAAKGMSDAPTIATTIVAGCLPKTSSDSQERWHLWILSESIRRTWLVAASLSPVFSALQRRWAACPGGVMYTNRSGVWPAANATEWEKRCSGRNAACLQRFDCARFLDDVEPADIDEFGTTMLDMTFNAELLEKWRDGTGRGIAA